MKQKRKEKMSNASELGDFSEIVFRSLDDRNIFVPITQEEIAKVQSYVDLVGLPIEEYLYLSFEAYGAIALLTSKTVTMLYIRKPMFIDYIPTAYIINISELTDYSECFFQENNNEPIIYKIKCSKTNNDHPFTLCCPIEANECVDYSRCKRFAHKLFKRIMNCPIFSDN